MQLYVAILLVVVLVLSTKSEAEKTITVEDNSSMPVNPEELNVKGDIVLPPRKNLARGPVGTKQRSKSSRQKLSWGAEIYDLPEVVGRWPTSVIPYVIDKDFTNEEKKRIFEAMADYHRNTCVKFQPRNKETDYIRITGHNDDNPGCNAALGRIGGGQVLNLELSERCVYNKRTIIHELMHALGFPHEHQRPGRHKYIQVNKHNIKEKYKPFFWEANKLVNHFGFGYDYESVLHYASNSATANNLPTIITLDPYYMNIIGRIPKLSAIDIKKINIMFNCTCRRI